MSLRDGGGPVQSTALSALGTNTQSCSGTSNKAVSSTPATASDAVVLAAFRLDRQQSFRQNVLQLTLSIVGTLPEV